MLMFFTNITFMKAEEIFAGEEHQQRQEYLHSLNTKRYSTFPNEHHEKSTPFFCFTADCHSFHC